MIDSETEMMELGRSIQYNAYNTRSLICKLMYLQDIIADGRTFYSEWVQTHTNTHTQTIVLTTEIHSQYWKDNILSELKQIQKRFCWYKKTHAKTSNHNDFLLLNRYFVVQRQPWKHQTNVWNPFKGCIVRTPLPPPLLRGDWLPLSWR